MKQEEIKQDIENRNTKGYFHGYQEWYDNSKIRLRAMCKNGRPVGYLENHYDKITRFRIR